MCATSLSDCKNSVGAADIQPLPARGRFEGELALELSHHAPHLPGLSASTIPKIRGNFNRKNRLLSIFRDTHKKNAKKSIGFCNFGKKGEGRAFPYGYTA